MAFAINTYGLPRLNSYHDAKLHWQNMDPWRDEKGEYDPRPLGNKPDMRRKRHMTISKTREGYYNVALYRTNVLTYKLDANGDTRIRFEPFSSVSTNAFVNAITPAGISPCYGAHGVSDALGFWTEGCEPTASPGGDWYNSWEAHRCVKILDGFELRRDPERYDMWHAVDMERTTPFVWPVLDRKAGNEALKDAGYHDCVTWCEAALAMGKRVQHTAVTHSSRYNEEVRAYLKMGPQGWDELLIRYGSIAEVKIALRDAIYALAMPFAVRREPWILRKDMPAYRRARLAWPVATYGLDL